MKADALNVEAKENSLRLSGTKSFEYEDKASLHRGERIAGSFDRTISLPIRIDPDRIKAELSVVRVFGTFERLNDQGFEGAQFPLFRVSDAALR